MASFKNNPAFFTSLLVIGAVTAAQAWLIYVRQAETKRLVSEVEQKRVTLQNFASANPFPSKENVAAVEHDRLQAEKTLREIRQELQATSELARKLAAAKVPASSTDAFFDLANFVERLRDSATKAGVTIPSNSWFGFGTYSSTGPVGELIEPVFRQRQHVEYLVDSLLAATPREIRAVERTRPLTSEQKAALLAAPEAAPEAAPLSAGGPRADVSTDYFVIDPRTSARVEGFVDTDAFRLTFTGTTDVLRSFLNELALFKLPVVVRSVEVEPQDKVLTTTTTTPSPVSAPASPFGLFDAFGQDSVPAAPVEALKPLIDQNDSVFVVTVEFIKLVDKSGPVATTP
jgi:hypothetical protein